ncbi:MAG: LysE family translocator [Oligoflexales bacterium]
MDLGVAWQGLLLGISVAAPVGPIAIICINTTLSKGLRHGVASGVGAAVADGLYGLVAVAGFAVILANLKAYERNIQTFGSIILCLLALKMFRSRELLDPSPTVNRGGLLNSFGSVFLLTLANPLTILFFVSAFSTVGVRDTSLDLAMIFVGCVFLGSALWWLGLSCFVTLCRRKMDADAVRLINRLSALVIFALGLNGLLG